jgi:hypothetical protein
VFEEIEPFSPEQVTRRLAKEWDRKFDDFLDRVIERAQELRREDAAEVQRLRDRIDDLEEALHAAIVERDKLKTDFERADKLYQERDALIADIRNAFRISPLQKTLETLQKFARDVDRLHVLHIENHQLSRILDEIAEKVHDRKKEPEKVQVPS